MYIQIYVILFQWYSRPNQAWSSPPSSPQYKQQQSPTGASQYVSSLFTFLFEKFCIYLFITLHLILIQSGDVSVVITKLCKVT